MKKLVQFGSMDFFLRTSATGTFRSFRSAGNYGIFNTINALSVLLPHQWYSFKSKLKIDK